MPPGTEDAISIPWCGEDHVGLSATSVAHGFISGQKW